MRQFPNKGYCLKHIPDVITREACLKEMDTEWAGQNIIYREEVDSTNTLAKKLGEEGAPHGTLVVADMQTRGKGRLGRSWYIPKDRPSPCPLSFGRRWNPSMHPC